MTHRTSTWKFAAVALAGLVLQATAAIDIPVNLPKPDGKPVLAKVALDPGKRYPVTITYFKGGSAAFWLASSIRERLK